MNLRESEYLNNKSKSSGSTSSERSIAYVQQELLEQIAFLNIMSIQRRIFKAWKLSFYETKTRIAKIITAMDFSEGQLLKNSFNNWKLFIKETKTDRADTFRSRVLAQRVAVQWKQYVSQNKFHRLERNFQRLCACVRINQIERILKERHQLRVKQMIFENMKALQQQQFDKQILKGFAKITREVELMRSTALESRRFYLFKRFFGIWSCFSKRRAFIRKSEREMVILKARKTKERFLYEWVNTSILCFQARNFAEKILLRKTFEQLQFILSKKVHLKKMIKNQIEVKIIKKKKLILHEWWRWAEKRRINQKKCEAYLIMARQRRMELMFLTFKRELQRTIQKEKFLYLSMKHYQISTTKRCFQAWAEFLEDSQKYYLDNITAMRHLKQKTISKTFNSLQQFILNVKQTNRNEFYIQESKKNRTVMKQFAFMKTMMKNTAQKVQLEVEKLNHKKVRNIFNSWRVHSEDRNEQRIRLRNSIDLKKSQLLKQIVQVWSRRSVDNKLNRTQKTIAKRLAIYRLQQKCFSRISKLWKDKKLGQLIEQKRKSRVLRNSYLIWKFLKLQEQQINSFWIRNFIQKSQIAFQRWRSIASKKAYQKNQIQNMKQKRERMMVALGWKVWIFFLKNKDEKNMYRVSLHRYSLMRRCKVILRALHNHLLKKSINQKKFEMIQQKSSYWKKMTILRIMKEKACDEISILAQTKRLRRRWDFKKSRIFFVQWALLASKRYQQNKVAQYLVNQKQNQIKIASFDKLKQHWIQKKLQKQQLDMAIQFNNNQLFQKAIFGLYKNSNKQKKIIRQKQHILTLYKTERRQRDALFCWYEAFQDNIFERATKEIQRKLTIGIAFRQFIKQQHLRLKGKKAVHCYVMFSMRKSLNALMFNVQKQKLKKNQAEISGLIGKKIAWKRMINKFKIAQVVQQKKIDIIQQRKNLLLRYSFQALVNNQQFRMTQRKIACTFDGIRSQHRMKSCFKILQENVDQAIQNEARINRFLKKSQGSVKKRVFQLWKSGFFSRMIEKRRQSQIQKKINLRLLRISFSMLHDNIYNSQTKTRTKQLWNKFFSKNLKKNVFSAWKNTLLGQHEYVEKSNLAFRHYTTALKEKVLHGWRIASKSYASKTDLAFNSVVFRGEALRRQAFEGLRWNQQLKLVERIIEQKSKLKLMQSSFLKWMRKGKKQTFGLSVVQKLGELLKKLHIQQSFQKIKECARFKQILTQIADIYDKNLKLSFLEVFTKNIIMHRRLNRFTLSQNNSQKQKAFYVLQQYNTFKKRRHLRIVSVLSAIHNAMRFNLARNAFYSLKRNQYINRLKRNTIIRYAIHLKFVSFFSFRKYVIRMRSKRMIEEMAIQHKKSFYLEEWKNRFLQDEVTRNNPKSKRYYQEDEEDQLSMQLSRLQYKQPPAVLNNGTGSYNRYTQRQSSEINNYRHLQSSPNLPVFQQVQSPTVNSMLSLPLNQQSQFLQQQYQQFHSHDPSIPQQTNIMNTYQSVELASPAQQQQQQLMNSQTNYNASMTSQQPIYKGWQVQKFGNNPTVVPNLPGLGGQQSYNSNLNISQPKQQQFNQQNTSDELNSQGNTFSTRSVTGLPASIGISLPSGINSSPQPFLSYDSFASNQFIQSVPLQHTQQLNLPYQNNQPDNLNVNKNLENQYKLVNDIGLNNYVEMKTTNVISPKISQINTNGGLDEEIKINSQQDGVNLNGPNLQRLFNEKRYQQLDLEHIEENIEENSQSIINRSQIDQSRKTSLHKSGVKALTNKSVEDLASLRPSNSKSKGVLQEEQDYYFVQQPHTDDQRKRQTTLEYFSGKNQN